MSRSRSKSGARQSCAFIELKPGHAATAEEIIAYCRGHMAHYKAPRHIVFAELPKTSTGKIQKHVLREKAKALDNLTYGGLASFAVILAKAGIHVGTVH